MSLFRNVVFIAAIAGLVAGIGLAILQAFATDPLILQAEVYENAASQAAPVHDHGAAVVDAAPAMSEAGQAMTAASPAVAAHEHEHDEGGWSPADGIERNTYNIIANVVTGVGFALILVAFSEFAGGIAGWRSGVFWGLAGFAVFTLAPGLGLPPELPAMPAADLTMRQIWWVSTAIATAAGLALIAFRKSLPLALLGVALIVAPHVVGAPLPDSFETPVPESLHHQFVVAVTMTNLVFWILLGATVGVVRARFTGAASSLRDSLRDVASLTFVLGGARSGKSAHAEALAAANPAPWIYVATAQAFDDEMRARIDLHRARRGDGWTTVDAPLDLVAALGATPVGMPVLVDCLTLWLTNHLLAEHDLEMECGRLSQALSTPRGPWFVVSNEVGLGIVPDNALARRFRDAAGRLNQQVAAAADHVLLMVAGLPIQVK